MTPAELRQWADDLNDAIDGGINFEELKAIRAATFGVPA